MANLTLNRSEVLQLLMKLAISYSVIALVAIAALAVFSITRPSLVNEDAWVHCIVVGVFALVLPLRAKAAAEKRSALRATGIIAAVLFVVNVVEAFLPNFMPTWLRVVMVAIALIMACIVGLVTNVSLKERH